MLLRATPSRRSLVLLDFLAPSLITRSSSTYKHHKPRPRSLNFQDPKTLSGSQVNEVYIQALGQHISERHRPDETLAIPYDAVESYNASIQGIRRALKSSNTQELSNILTPLIENGQIAHLQLDLLNRASIALKEAYLSSHNYNQEWDSVQRKLVEDVAVTAAASGFVDALKSCMLVLIRRSDPEGVITLYNRFKTLIGDQDAWKDPTVDPSEDFDALALASAPELEKRVHHIPERVYILLGAVTAYAIRNDFQGALKMCLDTVVRFQNYSTKTFLDNLMFNEDLMRRVERYVQRLDLARMVERAPSLSKQITNYSRSREIKVVERLYNSIIQAITAPDTYIAPDPSQTTPIRSVALTEIGWVSFLSAFLENKRTDLASQLWDDRTKFGLPHPAPFWTCLIDSHARTGSFAEAMGVWEMMHDKRVKPTLLTHRAFISALFAGKRGAEALKHFTELQKQPLEKLGTPSEVTFLYNTILHGLLFCPLRDQAMPLLEQMERNGPAPDVVTYNSFLAFHGQKKDLRGLAAMVTRMTNAGVAGDVISFSTILTALLACGREDASDMVLSLMKKQGLKPSVVTYTSIIKHQMQGDTTEGIKGMWKMLHRMEQDSDVQPNEVTYTSILAGLARPGWLDPQTAEAVRQEIVERMHRRGVKLDSRAYTVLIKTSLGNMKPSGLQDAVAYYRRMVQENVPRTQSMWYQLLFGLITRQEWVLAQEMVGDFFASRCEPNEAILELVKKIRHRTVSRIRPGGYM